MKCRHCSHEVMLPFCDLGTAPPSNAYLRAEQLDAPERHYPLRVKVCSQCWLAQTQDFTGADELFDPDYAYFSSTSTSWLAHAQTYVQQMAEDERCALLVRGFVRVFQEMGLAVVAAATETEQHRPRLLEMCSHLGPVYLFARPAPHHAGPSSAVAAWS